MALIRSCNGTCNWWSNGIADKVAMELKCIRGQQGTRQITRLANLQRCDGLG